MKYGGMTEREALAMITLNGAKQLGLDKRTGSIEVGKDADLAVFNGHPLNSYARVEMTLVDGEVYFERKDRKPSRPPPPRPRSRWPAADPARRPDAQARRRSMTPSVHPVSATAIEQGHRRRSAKGGSPRSAPTTDEDRKRAGAVDADGAARLPRHDRRRRR